MAILFPLQWSQEAVLVIASRSKEAEFYTLGSMATRALVVVTRTLNYVEALRLKKNEDVSKLKVRFARAHDDHDVKDEFVSPITVIGDSAAAQGLCQRCGTNRARHLVVRFMWLQAGVSAHRFVPTVTGTWRYLDNPADLGAKSLKVHKIVEHRKEVA